MPRRRIVKAVGRGAGAAIISNAAAVGPLAGVAAVQHPLPDPNPEWLISLQRLAQQPGLSHHPENDQQLLKIADTLSIPHLLLLGPAGCGKAYRARAILCHLFGEARISGMRVVKMNMAETEFTVLESDLHVELDLSTIQHRCHLILPSLIDRLAAEVPGPEFVRVGFNQKPFKCLILRRAHELGREAQHVIRRTMERHTTRCRLFLCARTISTLIPSLLSRALLWPIQGLKREDQPLSATASPCPSHSARVQQILQQIKPLAPAGAMAQLGRFEWYEYCTQIATNLLDAKNGNTAHALTNIVRCRVLVSDLLTRAVLASDMMRVLCKELFQQLHASTLWTDDQKRGYFADISRVAHECEGRRLTGSNGMLHIETFLLSVTNILFTQRQ